MGDVCNTCALPEELCVCEDVDASQTVLSVEVDERNYGKKMTAICGFSDEADLSDISSDLKSEFACGGTIKDGNDGSWNEPTILLQGDHTNRIREYLQEQGFKVESESNDEEKVTA